MVLSQNGFSSLLKSNVVFGVNSVRENLVKKINELGKSKVFIATDEGLVKAGIANEVTDLLDENNIEYTVFSAVEPNPRGETVMRGAEVYKDEECDMIISIGGGSPIDFAKAVGVAVSHSGDILDYRRGEKVVENTLPTLFAIPTTVGTGSEVTGISVVTDSKKGRKYIIAAPLLIPDYAIIDPSLTTSLPRHIVSTTAVDALVHALEAYVSTGSNPFSDGLALQAIKMIKEYLPATYANPGNIEARSQVHLASTIAGMAFAIGGLGMVHSCSHPMSARYDVPHGLANSILLPPVVEHNLIANHGRYAEIARIFDPELRNVSDVKAAEALVGILREFIGRLDIGSDFSHLDMEFTEEMVDQLAEDAMNDIGTIPKNPRKGVKADIAKIYRKVLAGAVSN